MSKRSKAKFSCSSSDEEDFTRTVVKPSTKAKVTARVIHSTTHEENSLPKSSRKLASPERKEKVKSSITKKRSPSPEDKKEASKQKVVVPKKKAPPSVTEASSQENVLPKKKFPPCVTEASSQKVVAPKKKASSKEEKEESTSKSKNIKNSCMPIKKSLPQQKTASATIENEEKKSILGNPITISTDLFNSILEQLNTFLNTIAGLPFTDEYVAALKQQEAIITSFVQQIPTFMFGYTDQITYKVNNRILWIFDKWPHQSWTEAILGELFYPSELRTEYDLVLSIYERPNIRYRLAMSASYAKPVAYVHLNTILNDYLLLNENTIFPCETKLRENVASITTKSQSMIDKIKATTKQYFLRGREEGNTYVKAVSLMYNSTTEYVNFVREAVTTHKEYRLLPLFRSLRCSTECLTKYYLDALSNGYISALSFLASECKCLGETMIWSTYAAEKENVAAAYYSIALNLDEFGAKEIVEQMNAVTDPILVELKHTLTTDFKTNDIMLFLDKAADLGMSSAVQQKASMLSKKRDMDGVEATYIKAAMTLDDQFSWYLLGHMYHDNQDFEQAQDCFIKAGIRAYYDIILTENNHDRKEEMLHKLHEHLVVIEKLINRE